MNIGFCIPTCNRLPTLKETLQSIANDVPPNVEIIISDNSTNNETLEWIQNNPHPFGLLSIRYSKWKTPVEAGINLMKSVELSLMPYCFLMTDDDVIEKGCFAKASSILTAHPNLSGISINVTGYDKTLCRKKTIRYPHLMRDSFLFEDAKSCFANIGPYLGFWSAQIINKSRWNLAKEDQKYKNYIGYHHLYLITKMLQNNPLWYFLDFKGIGYRADNETFSAEHGFVKRFEIDALTYKTIGKEFFGNTKATHSCCNLVIKKYLFWQVINAKIRKVNTHQLLSTLVLSFKHTRGFLSFWTHLLIVHLTPRFVILFARYIYRKTKKLSQ